MWDALSEHTKATIQQLLTICIDGVLIVGWTFLIYLCAAANHGIEHLFNAWGVKLPPKLNWVPEIADLMLSIAGLVTVLLYLVSDLLFLIKRLFRSWRDH